MKQGTLVMVPEAVRRDPDALHQALVAQRIERIFLPYVALQMIAQAAGDDLPSHLTDVISAGEQLQVTPAIRRLFERLPHAALHNHYGPTESHVVTAFELTGPAGTWPEIPAIGRALPNYLVALFLILLFARELRWLPTRGWGSIEEAILPNPAKILAAVEELARY